MSRPTLLFFTDLDGTLLDHDSYDWTPAKPALAELERHRLPLILNSSKTAAEIRDLRSELANEHPYIVENGAAAIIPAGYFDAGQDEDEVIHFAQPRARVLESLARLREQGFRFTGFDDMSVEEVAQHADLSRDQAAKAKDRAATEPVVWNGGALDVASFRQALEQEGLRLVKGGRFHHVMGDFDKAEAMKALIKRYRARYPDSKLVSVALGDSPNDRRMLEAADIAVVIRGPEPLTLSEGLSVMYSDQRGPSGWNECVLTILAGKGY
ncbi:MAG: HAD-IIB family hydrolase [Marinobacter sp.]|uniref:HAD-IIB family hydrolase n=1 Tax=Marinobacter sp. TaxID=50741 RepID=UPI00299E41FB|nr:HAD-IIB family hydrolase [Marinobacter sp.]MDX1635503.1 HAD-IIB family hydrolase [Marinobacter sp.]